MNHIHHSTGTDSRRSFAEVQWRHIIIYFEFLMFEELYIMFQESTSTDDVIGIS